LEADPSSGQLLALVGMTAETEFQKEKANSKAKHKVRIAARFDSLLLKAFGSRSLVAARKALAVLSG
jgi:hypothetical protein